MRILDKFGVVPIIEPADYGSAGITSDSFKMDKGQSAALIFTFGAITGDSTLIISSGLTLAAITTGLACRYRLASGVFKATASADQYAAAAALASTGITLTATTYKNRTLIVDIDAAEMPDANAYLTAVISSTATVMLVSCVALLGGGRYQPALTNIV
jgi:hypothetical protein